MKRIRAFTLIELLVVVAIIIALLAILLPSMNRAIEVGHRAVCRSQLHQMQLAHLSFATDNFGELTPSQLVTDNPARGAYMIWASYMTGYAPNAPHNRYRGNGYLIRSGYMDTPQILYCPSWEHPNIMYGGPTGWPDDGSHPGPSGMNIVQTSYHYRSSFEGPKWRPARLSRDPGGSIILSDHFSGYAWAGVDYGHVVGYSYVTLDGAGGWHDDPDYVIRDFNSKSSYNKDISGYLLQEQVFNEVMDRQ